MSEPKICEEGGEPGLFLPLGGDDEARWPDWLQAILYLLGLLWCFMGVAIIAEVFMSAIETVTSKKRRRQDEKTGKMITVKVWNNTVANLTLMALGSSAPEILLNVKDIFQLGFHSSALGPSTIVGSAAFNLLVIIAVCVSAIPPGETRAIADLGVYSVTAGTSVFAYMWLLVILVGITPNRVDVIEGLLTFLFFPAVVYVAYLADIGKLPYTKKPPRKDLVHPESTPEEIEDMKKEIERKYGTGLAPQQVAALIEYEFSDGPAHSRAYRRATATRELFRGKRAKSDFKYQGQVLSKTKKLPDGGAAEFSFERTEYPVLESKECVQIKVLRLNDFTHPVKVAYKTRPGTAKDGSDYTGTEGELNFDPADTEKTIEVQIMKSPEHEDTEYFYVDLSLPAQTNSVALGPTPTTTVAIIDENHPGKLRFGNSDLRVDAPSSEKKVNVLIQRIRGSDGKISCAYQTENDTALAGVDYEALSGTLEFENGALKQSLELTLLPKPDSEDEKVFRLILTDDGQSGQTVMFDETTDGGKESAILTVSIGLQRSKSANNVVEAFRFNHDQMRLGNERWKDQFREAIYVNGSREDMAQASPSDWIVHIIAVPWKLFFACVPPVDYCGGWLCFFVALGAIGFVTCLIGDLAALLGCSFGISDFTTAITFVALGTSLPDTFASKTAAVQDGTADASIGNVTGSNCVNVFLGLGLPWLIAAIYWSFQDEKEGGEWYRRYPDEAKRYPHGAFIVKSDGLGLSVAVFSVCSCACILTLAARRYFLKAELGGPKELKWLTSGFFVLLWVVYISISIMNDNTE